MLKKLLKSLGFGKKEPRQDKPVGVVTHYYGKLGVAIVKFNQEISLGNNVTFHGESTDFSQNVDSMQLDHKSVDAAPRDTEIGIKVKNKVREGDKVFLNK